MLRRSSIKSTGKIFGKKRLKKQEFLKLIFRQVHPVVLKSFLMVSNSTQKNQRNT
jgi:hypothetical protein